MVEESIDMGAFKAALRHGSDAFDDEPANDEDGDDDDDDEKEVEAEEDGGVEEEAIDSDGAAADFRLP